MKKVVLTAIAATCALSVFAQGTIIFNNILSGKVVTHVYAPLAGAPGTSQIGNGSGDFPVGTTDWSAYTLIGATAGLYNGPGTYAELYAAPGQNQLEANLQPAYSGGVTSFRSGALTAGFLYGKTPTFNNIAPDYTGGATVEMFAWDNRSGLYPTWASAQPAWSAGLIAAGNSGLFNITAVIGGDFNIPPNLLGLRSFNLYFIPEPSSFALAGLGAAALLVFRRHK